MVGHDIGLMVAYAYAAQYPTRSRDRADGRVPAGHRRLEDVWLMRDLWHFHFYGETPLKLVKGRERIYFEHFWNDFAADRTTRSRKPTASSTPRPMRSPADARRLRYFKAFEQDAKDFAEFAKTKLTMPVLVLSGEKAGGHS